MRRLLLGLLAGCGFSGPTPNAGDVDAALGDVAVVDADPDAMPTPFVIPHVMDGDRMPGDGDLSLAGPIDTTSPSTAQPGVEFALADAAGGGPRLAILHVHRFTIPFGETVTVTGSHPLVVIAQIIDIEGTLAAGATKSADGPGAGTAGAGGKGEHNGNSSDGGGGGGGYGSAGAAGGAACSDPTLAKGGPAGTVQQGVDIVQLIGGAHGGVAGSGSCQTDVAGGGGGGAVQLSAYQSVTIGAHGIVDVGGGGGTGGSRCTGDGSSGGGGGAGGAIVLNSPSITVDGTLVANGGGGGGAGCFDSTSPGDPGADGSRSADAAAGGRGVSCGGNGGNGAAAASPQTGVTVACGDNGGGGGGGLGRIAYVVPATGQVAENAIVVSPPSHTITTP